MTYHRVPGFRHGLALASTLFLLASLRSAPPVADADFPKLLTQGVAAAKGALAGPIDKRSADQARYTVLLLAEFAQHDLTGPDASRRATIRDAALALADRIKAKEYDLARKELDALANLPAQATAKKARARIPLDMEEVMSLFREPKLGGLGIEAEFDKLSASKGALPAAALNDRLLFFAWCSALTGERIESHVPQMKRKEWKGYSVAMNQAAIELIDAVKARNGQAAGAALNKANANCAACHKVFR